MTEFLRSDEPAVRGAIGDEGRCADCAYWSRWLPHTGDCMMYAMLRREALFAADDLDRYYREWPSKSARVTSDHECCDRWLQREGQGLSR
ncbi:hypothetical protein [Stakelama tenebrarum]|uniref:Uncharacterized protein n=1 Tax=Stakelama tenebrarum TaxID=2711215 RepID=A0A6G6Y589_9SPHN|nr:hypothetical protein [Sphingosinithalassobacter tenebrarum]QIG80070.1 hypothetical protein G5C33_09950 [Sphingosinithalassobacter tenebrarum]